MPRSAQEMVVRSSVRVPLGPEDAFRLFTERVADWWPLETHSVHERQAASVRFEPGTGGRIVEESATGETPVWGTITIWDPPRRLAFTWHPGEDGSVVTQVEIGFRPAAEGGTLVDLVHTGWEAKGERAEALAKSYGPGWELVLGRYAQMAKRMANGAG